MSEWHGDEGGGKCTTCDPKPRGCDFLPHYFCHVCWHAHYETLVVYVTPLWWGLLFCRTCEVEGPLYLYSTLLGRGWPCYHVLEGPTDFKGVVLKVWTCGLGGGVLLTKGDTDTHPIYCSIADFLRFCKLWFVWSGPTLQFSGEITVYF